MKTNAVLRVASVLSIALSVSHLKANGAYSFTVTLLLLGVVGGLSTVLALRELWVSWRPARA